MSNLDEFALLKSSAVKDASKNNDDDGPKRKHGGDWVRKRVTRACDQCRKKKLKCDGVRPSCTSCVTLNRDCVYADITKKRGLPEGYVKRLEKLLGFVLVNATGLENVITTFECAATDEAAKMDLVRQWKREGEDASNTLLDVWRTSDLCKSLAQVLPLPEDADKPHDAKRPRLESHIPGNKECTASQVSPPLPLPSQSIAEQLFKIYFSHTNSWFPIMIKDELLATYYQAIELPDVLHRKGENAALWAVLSYAEYKRHCGSYSDQAQSYMPQSSVSISFYEKAASLIPSEDSCLGIHHVRALLVLSLIKLAMGQLRESWLLVNRSINIVIDISMAERSASVATGPGNSFKRIHMGCFYLDTLLSACLGRAPRYQKDYIRTLGSLEETGLEEWGPIDLGERQGRAQFRPCRSLSIFNHLINLTCILNDSVNNQSQKTSPELHFKAVQTRLNEWKSSIPTHCSLMASLDPAKRTELYPHNLNLDLTFAICTKLIVRNLNVEIGDEPKESMDATKPAVHNMCSEVDWTMLPPMFSLLIKLGPKRSGLTTRGWLNADLASAIGGDWSVVSSAPASAIDSDLPGTIIAHETVDQSSQVSNSSTICPVQHSRAHQDGSPALSQLRRGSMGEHVRTQDVTTIDSSNWSRTGNHVPVEHNRTTSINYQAAQQGTPPSKAATPSIIGHNSLYGVVSNGLVFSPENPPDAYSAAESLMQFTRSSRMNQLPTVDKENELTRLFEQPQTSLSVNSINVANTKGTLEERSLHTMTQLDDDFFELINLEFLTGDQNETYRHLGLLPTTNGTDLSSESAQAWQHADGILPAQGQDEWSQYFGRPGVLNDEHNHGDLHMTISEPRQS
ncbi:hypothetical protein VTL71DRAFT_15547 [Oculimacula yallundae]|uniref:Zn(2)-C6 fungal-type domain-containing protein n=1 Tax=Oculimacula yallundae TaxID=86028 RepID=A0ABR4CHI1_9HELO